jgi:DNA-binding PadR family transcriptional regulator
MQVAILIESDQMAPRPLSTDLTAITTLGLLAERPRHPYEMQRLIRERGKSYVKGLPRSMYHAIDRLAKAGLVEAGEPSREGRRPERTVYAITETGREELEAWLTDLLAVPDHDDSLTYPAALSLIAYLPPETATAALRARLTPLDIELGGSRARMEGMRPILPRLFLVEEEYRLGMIESERGFTARLVDDLERGKLTWDVGELRRLAESGSDDWEALRLATGEPPS